MGATAFCAATNTMLPAIASAELTSAIQKFNAMEDRFPRDLNEVLQQHYLQASPAAPMGMR